MVRRCIFRGVPSTSPILETVDTEETLLLVIAGLAEAYWQNCLFSLRNQALQRFLGKLFFCDAKCPDSCLLECNMDTNHGKCSEPCTSLQTPESLLPISKLEGAARKIGEGGNGG